MYIGKNENNNGGLLANRTVLVTGGSSGIGRGICETVAREGGKVAFTWNLNEDGASTTEDLVRKFSGDCLSIKIDMRDKNAGKIVATKVEDAWGRIDGLVNNAAVSEAMPFTLIDDADMEDLMEINFFAVFRFCKAVLRGMIRNKYGRVVNISSIAGTRSIAAPIHYAASKGAVNGLTRSLAHEVGPYGILVNAIAAGIFETGVKSTIPENHQKRYIIACSLNRLGEPGECGELTAWLLSDRNTYMNGTVLFLEGGTLA